MINKRWGVEHFGYRLIALFIAMILWVTVISQRETISIQKMKIQFVVPSEFKIEGPGSADIEVRLEGTRPNIRRFLERHWVSNMVVPVRNPSLGLSTVDVPVKELQLPPEIKVLSISPREVVLQIKKK